MLLYSFNLYQFGLLIATPHAYQVKGIKLVKKGKVIIFHQVLSFWEAFLV